MDVEVLGLALLMVNTLADGSGAVIPGKVPQLADMRDGCAAAGPSQV